jgi:hypothetical protein
MTTTPFPRTLAERLKGQLRRPWIAVVVGTLGLGATVVASWFLFGGSIAFRGPVRTLEESWPAIYASQAALAAGGTFLYQRLAGPLPLARLAPIVGAAWLGELVVLRFAGWLFANELTGEVAGFFWLIGTGGPIQPLAALLGGWIGLRGRSATNPPSPAK